MSLHNIAAATLTLALVASLTPGVTPKCQFPSFLQRKDAWVGDYKYGLLVAYVKGDRIDLTQSEEGSTSVSFTGDCVQQEPGNKYLVRHREPKQAALYRCIQFFQRGDWVVQIRASNYSHGLSSEICAEKKMSFDPYPWVQIGDKNTSSSTLCPFIGGYNMMIYYAPPNNSLVCSNSFLLMRMESECERGGGIVFDFRSEACVPRGLPRGSLQQVRCVTHWTQEDYTFIILQHATQERHWFCLRISDILTDLKSAYLWIGVVCDMNRTPSLEVSPKFLRLNFDSRVFSSTCEDELEVCEGTEHYCQINYKHHCAATCRGCQSEKSIGECAFDEQFRGRWMDGGRDEDRLIEVDAYVVKGDGLGTYSCLRLEPETMPEKRVLLELYDNGCFPRYACLEMSKVNSAVMKFRLGHRYAWPLWSVGNIKQHICQDKNLRMHGDRHSKTERERPPRLLIDTEHVREVHCELPKQFQNGIAFQEDGPDCSGCLNYMPDYNPRMFTVRPINCSDRNSNSNPGAPAQESQGQQPPHRQPIHYSCLASFQFHNGTYSVVTRTKPFARGMGHYLVWIFTDKQIKVMKASDTFMLEHRRSIPSSYLKARFSILSNDMLKCRSYGDWPVLPSTTAPSGHYRNASTSATAAPPFSHNGNKHVTYLPDNGRGGGGGGRKHAGEDSNKPGPSHSKILQAGDGNGSGRQGGSASGLVTLIVTLVVTSSSVVALACRRITGLPPLGVWLT